jgi:hypothetical protein
MSDNDWHGLLKSCGLTPTSRPSPIQLAAGLPIVALRLRQRGSWAAPIDIANPTVNRGPDYR